MILIIDNYDSFSYNLYQMMGEIHPDIRVVKNDQVTVEQILAWNPSHIVLSPGPGRPSDAGVTIEVIQKLHDQFPMLGVCLGHQAICEAFGGVVSYADRLMHGKSSLIDISPVGIFAGMSPQLTVARYHSLIAKVQDFPQVLEVIAHSTEGEIMAVRHRDHPVYGVQFHPESILTPDGATILRQFLAMERQ